MEGLNPVLALFGVIFRSLFPFWGTLTAEHRRRPDQDQRQRQRTRVSVLHEQGQRLRTTSRTALRVFVVPTFRKGRERWATRGRDCAFYTCKVKGKIKVKGSGRGRPLYACVPLTQFGAGQG
jgi:hypothetical protein